MPVPDDDERPKKASAAKTKDLSHVPCKFFKVGSCTAGGSCPFSHSLQEPGGQKDVCAWFVKGNCKFGHKCALAHVLPGQPMTMDRKNKKAAQVAAGVTNKDAKPKGNKKDNKTSKSRPPITMQLKASIAPALQDTDFASQLPTAPALAGQSQDSSAPNSNDPPVASSPPSSSPIDFGPIGSPPRSGGIAASPLKPGASPSFLSTSPFSAPGPQSVFHPGRSGIASSLGATLAFGDEKRKGRDVAVEDGDLEDFLPSSLTDLLTPEERSRRMSRSNSGQKPDGLPINPTTPNTSGHRYSRSVPAPSLLGDISSIWSSKPNQPSSPPRVALGGTPSSFTSASGRFDPLGDDLDSMLNPTNASAAFLPSIHQQYFNANGLGRGIRNTSNPLLGTQYSRTGSGNNTPSQQLPRTSAAGTFTERPIPGQTFDDTPNNLGNIISPGTRALQNHAPGQSLPQGLAAGYSRIHALPPVPIASPTNSSVVGASVSPGNAFATGPFGTLNGNDWGKTKAGSTEFNALFNKLSYSAAAARGSNTPSQSSTPNQIPTPPGMSRNVSGGSRWGAHQPLSPLSGGVVAAAATDDDALFAMDSMDA